VSTLQPTPTKRLVKAACSQERIATVSRRIGVNEINHSAPAHTSILVFKLSLSQPRDQLALPRTISAFHPYNARVNEGRSHALDPIRQWFTIGIGKQDHVAVRLSTPTLRAAMGGLTAPTAGRRVLCTFAIKPSRRSGHRPPR
jgi:hypothetical protein